MTTKELERKRIYRKTYNDKHPWAKYYGFIITRCRPDRPYGKRGIKCLLTTNDLKLLWFRDKAYLMRKPSIDRKDTHKNYTIDNCRFRELTDNNRDRKLITKMRVGQYTLYGKFIKKWNSLLEIKRTLDYGQSTIRSCCNGRYKKAYGFTWKSLGRTKEYIDG